MGAGSPTQPLCSLFLFFIMFKTFTKVFAAGAIALSASPAMAMPGPGGNNLGVNATNNAQNVQSNSGSVNLAPMGGSNANYQINSVSNSQFGFAPGITCPTPELAIGAFGGGTNGWADYGYGNGGSNYGATVMFTTPIGGDTGEYCKKLAQQIALQRELDTDLNMIKQCAVIARENISVDLEKFPNFDRCTGVVVDGKVAIADPNAPVQVNQVFTPEETVAPVIPVRKAN